MTYTRISLWDENVISDEGPSVDVSLERENRERLCMTENSHQEFSLRIYVI